MTSTKPYLIRAIHEWCSDNGLTPHLAVAVTDQVRVPTEHVRNGEIVLNIGVLATDKLQITNEEISFQARFSGRVQQILVPMENITAIYAKENGSGMAFEVGQAQALQADTEESPGGPETEPHLAHVSPQAPPHGPQAPLKTPPSGRPKLTRVK
jgi:stringent starvation protein B